MPKELGANLADKGVTAHFSADHVFNELWELDIDYLVAVGGSQGPLWESAGTIYVAERDRLGPRRIPLVIKPTHRKCAMCGAPGKDR